MRKARLAASICGNILEWYDFALLAYLAPVLSRVIFVEADAVASLLNTLIIYAIGFLMRPVGAILFGNIGDNYGRAIALKISIGLISLSTILMAFVPSYQTIGLLSPLFFSILRLIQGLALGGEFAGSMVYLCESAIPNRRALTSAMTNNGSNFGIMLATIVSATLTQCLGDAAFASYGWRIAFLFGGTIGLTGLRYRKILVETTIFEKIKKTTHRIDSPVKHVLIHHRPALLQICSLLCMSAAGSYILMGYLSTYLHIFQGLDLAQALRIQCYFILATFVFVPLFGLIADTWGRRPVLIACALAYVLVTIPAFYYLNISGNYLWLAPLMLIYSAEQAATPVAMVEHFPPEVRYTGVSLSYNITMALVGGFAPYLNTLLIYKLGDHLIPAYFIVCTAVITGLTAMRHLSKSFGATLSLA